MRWVLMGIGAVVVALAFAGAAMVLWDEIQERKDRKERKGRRKRK